MAELTLPQRLREAADVVQELSALVGYPNPDCAPWDARSLRTEASVIESDVPA